MKQYLIIMLAGFLSCGCNQTSDSKEGHQEKTPLNEQTEEMLAIHDSIMPHMDKLMDLKKQIKADIEVTDSLLAVKSTEALKSRKEEGLKNILQLDSADNAMMSWMHAFKFDTLEKLNKTQAASYVADQRQKIESVRAQMSKSLSEANLFIEKTKKK